MPDVYYRLPSVLKLTGLSRTTLYEMIRQGTFPKPILIGRRSVAWSGLEITQWQDYRKAVRH
jgi:prophage regulatory protein